MKSKLLAVVLLSFMCLTARAASDAAEWKHLNRAAKKALEKNDFAQAEQLSLQAAALAEPFGPKDERYAESWRILALAATQLRHYENANLAYTRLVSADGARWGTNDLRVAQDLLGLVEVLGYTRDFEQAGKALDRASAIIGEKAGKFSWAMGRCDAARAGFELQQGHLAQAEANYQKALELLDGSQSRLHFSGDDLQMKESYFEPSQTYLSEVLNNMAICQRQEKKYAEAEASLLRAIKLIEWKYGDNSLHLVNPLYNLAGTYLDDGKLSQAKSAAQRTLAALKTIDPNHPMNRSARALLAKILLTENSGGR